MAKRRVNKGVTIVREGKRVRPEIGKNFDFTADEIERIAEVDSAALGKADGGEDGEAATASTTAKTTETTDAPATSGQTKKGKAAGEANGGDAGGEAGTDDDL
jgi:hypothetical protein